MTSCDRVLPSTRPAVLACTMPMTLPMSDLLLAPVSATAVATMAETCSALMAAGRYFSRTTISALSFAASSGRPALSNCSIESLRCLICFRTIARASAFSMMLSLLPDSMAALVRAVLTARRVARATVSLAFIAVLRSSMIVSAKVLIRVFWRESCSGASTGLAGVRYYDIDGL